MADQHRLLRFSDSPGSSLPSSSRSTYQLLSLPPALLSLLTSPSSSSDSTPLEIRGDPTDSAALVTPTQTYALRGVQNSNSLCICSSGLEGGSGGLWFNYLGHDVDEDKEEEDMDEEGRPRKRLKQDSSIEIESVLHETLEAVAGVPRTEKLVGLLNGCNYTGEQNEIDHPPEKKVSFDDLRSRLPASDLEIRSALNKNRILDLDDSLRSIPPSFLLTILPSLLSSLPLPAILAHPPNLSKKKSKPSTKPTEPVVLVSEAEESELLEALDSVDCGKLVGLTILGWFGEQDHEGGRWKFELEGIVRELGIDLLAAGGFGQQPLESFLTKWKELCGGFSPLCSLPLLSGLSLSRPTLAIPTIQYLPSSSLSPDPSTRFSELFALQPKWLESDMSLFVKDLTGGDKKKMDALVLKFVRKVKGSEGSTWWTPRNLWN